MECVECSAAGESREVVTVCADCGQPLCEAHQSPDEKDPVGGMRYSSTPSSEPRGGMRYASAPLSEPRGGMRYTSGPSGEPRGGMRYASACRH